ncbi:MAG: type 4a pilus biogenesis protein PilO [Candidatus Beckwithbacteria bacterium]
MSLNQRLTIARNYDRYYKRFKLWTQKPDVRVSGLASLTVFTIAFFLMVAILPTSRTIATLNREISDQETVDSKLTQKIVSLKAAETNFAAIVNNLPEIKEVLPESERFERLVWQIYWVAQQAGVEITSGSLGEFNLLNQRAEPGKPVELTVNLTISGNYQQVKNFVTKIAAIDRLLTIVDLSLSNKNSKISNKLTVNLKLAGFYLPLTGGQ